MANKVFEYKLKLNSTQQAEVERLLWETKCIYNRALEKRINHYKENGKSLNFFVLDKEFNKTTCPDVPAVIVDTTLARMDRSFQNFFRGIKRGEKVGFPRFQSIRRWDSFQFRDWKSAGKIVEKEGRHFWKLSRNHLIRIIWHRDYEGVPKFTRLVKKCDGYYVQLTTEITDKAPVTIKKAIGLDMGLKFFVADSTDKKVKPPKYFRLSEWKLRHAQRKLSKAKRGSNLRRKKVILVAKIHKKISDQRKDFLHKVSRNYANKYDAVMVEDLNTKGMVRNHHLAKSISDASWSMFFNLLQYKLQTLGKRLVKINPYNTSKECSNCKALVPKPLSQRVHICPHCGFVSCRDTNASLNILKRGLISLEQAIGEAVTVV